LLELGERAKWSVRDKPFAWERPLLVLLRLGRIGVADLRELIVEAWLARGHL
jgi:hypothetical protein